MNPSIVPYFLDSPPANSRSQEPSVELMALVEQGQNLRIRFHGSLGLENHRELRAVLEDVLQSTEQPTVVVDLSRVLSISSSGFGALVDVAQRLQNRGRELLLTNLSDDCRQVMSLLKLDPFFRIQ
ncbi:MAG: STAS domain-containing protein [Leptospiraceae bacterium]|nr:STAS domain-containing protein [Leptospiraceae bacterium]